MRSFLLRDLDVPEGEPMAIAGNRRQEVMIACFSSGQPTGSAGAKQRADGQAQVIREVFGESFCDAPDSADFLPPWRPSGDDGFHALVEPPLRKRSAWSKLTR